MGEQFGGSRAALHRVAECVTMKDMIATIKVNALLEFSLTNPEFQKELSSNAVTAARFRGVELNDSELELLARTFGRLES